MKNYTRGRPQKPYKSLGHAVCEEMKKIVVFLAILVMRLFVSSDAVYKDMNFFMTVEALTRSAYVGYCSKK